MAGFIYGCYCAFLKKVKTLLTCSWGIKNAQKHRDHWIIGENKKELVCLHVADMLQTSFSAVPFSIFHVISPEHQVTYFQTAKLPGYLRCEVILKSSMFAFQGLIAGQAWDQTCSDPAADCVHTPVAAFSAFCFRFVSVLPPLRHCCVCATLDQKDIPLASHLWKNMAGKDVYQHVLQGSEQTVYPVFSWSDPTLPLLSVCQTY